MPVAVLCDIHGNLPALSAVLAEVAEARVDRIVVGGDIVPGPMPRQALDRLLATDVPVQFVHGNGERSALAQMAVLQGAPVTYWGTTSGNPLPRKTSRSLACRRSESVAKIWGSCSAPCSVRLPTGSARCSSVTPRRAARPRSSRA
jgi:hypothetical protein